MESLRPGLTALIATAALLCIWANMRILFLQVSGREGGTRRMLIPFAGGMLGAWVFRASGWRAYAWVPLLLDPGCAVFLMFFIVVLVRRRRRAAGHGAG